jgi:hypothetical protein
MRDGKILHCVLFCLCLFMACLSARAEEKILFREDFASLEQWRPVHFPNIKKHTDYSVETRGQEHYLRAESNASASALVYRQEFNPYEYPRVRWRWKVDNLYEKAQPGAKSGDDYPMRVYIVFRYDPASASLFEKFKYETMRALYGEYPPHSSLTYVWSSKVDDKKIHESPYTSKARVIHLREGDRHVGTWQEENINILEDYEKAFGKKPPPAASIGIMNDSDNTGERSVSYLDYIEVYR